MGWWDWRGVEGLGGKEVEWHGGRAGVRRECEFRGKGGTAWKGRGRSRRRRRGRGSGDAGSGKRCNGFREVVALGEDD